MSVDTEILNKTLVDCIKQYAQGIIYYNQVRFIPGMQVVFNIHKSINTIHYINELKNKNHMIISIDAGKSF